MKRTRVESSAVYAIGYDPKKKILEVELTNHTVYDYFNVPADKYEGFLSADSKGVYYNKVIKAYPYKQVA